MEVFCAPVGHRTYVTCVHVLTRNVVNNIKNAIPDAFQTDKRTFEGWGIPLIEL